MQDKAKKAMEENTMLVSIIVAIYKSESFLEKCVNSIIMQDYNNLEIILVNDGSPDNCGKICDDFANKDKRVKVIHKENGGACEARNYGLREARGDYIVIIDGDDWLAEDYVSYLLRMILENKAEMAMTTNIFTTRDQIQVKNDKLEIWSAEKAVASIIYPVIPIGPWNKMYSRKLIEENDISFSVPWSGEGLYFSAMAALNSNKIAVGNRKIYNYRLNNVNSGLTNYNIQMGINALSNIKYIGSKINLNSKILDNAIRWHTWKNYNYLLFLIVATNSVENQKELYKDCIHGIRSLLVKTIVFSDVSIKSKLKIFITGIIPVTMAKFQLVKTNRALNKDLMK